MITITITIITIIITNLRSTPPLRIFLLRY